MNRRTWPKTAANLLWKTTLILSLLTAFTSSILRFRSTSYDDFLLLQFGECESLSLSVHDHRLIFGGMPWLYPRSSGRLFSIFFSEKDETPPLPEIKPATKVTPPSNLLGLDWRIGPHYWLNFRFSIPLSEIIFLSSLPPLIWFVLGLRHKQQKTKRLQRIWNTTTTVAPWLSLGSLCLLISLILSNPGCWIYRYDFKRASFALVDRTIGIYWQEASWEKSLFEPAGSGLTMDVDLNPSLLRRELTSLRDRSQPHTFAGFTLLTKISPGKTSEIAGIALPLWPLIPLLALWPALALRRWWRTGDIRNAARSFPVNKNAPSPSPSQPTPDPPP